MSRDPYQAIMIAAALGKGLRLTAEEAHDLACDDAIETVANNRLTEEELNRKDYVSHWEFWRTFPKRRAGHLG